MDRSLGEQPRFALAVRLKAALCGHLGLMEPGKVWVSRLLELTPGFPLYSFHGGCGVSILDWQGSTRGSQDRCGAGGLGLPVEVGV